MYGNRSRFSRAKDKQWRRIVLAAVTKDGMNLKHPAVGKLINDKEVVMAAVRNNRMALEYASKDLKKDIIRDGIVSVVKPELILPLDNKEIIPEKKILESIKLRYERD